MKAFVLAVICTMALAGGAAAESGFSFDPASVRFGYADGYWDHERRWHPWPNAREAREFHRRFQDRIYGYRHTRYPNDGWRDEERTQKSSKTSADKKQAGKDS